MYRPQIAPAPRKGVIMLVVLALLTLFTILGISFVLYADSAATQARNIKDSNINALPNMEPEECLSLYLDQLLYDVRDDGNGVFSGMRGHGLSRNMYGFNYNWADVTYPNQGLTADLIVQQGNDVAFNGVGKLHYACTAPVALTDATTNAQVDDWKLVNYMYFTSDGFLRDPERYGSRTALRRAGQPDNRGPYLGSANVSYTYPDINNFYLAAIDGSGNLITPSFHREWLFGRLDAYPNNPYGLAVNPNWTNAVGKYMTTRPRPQENPGFPYPVDRYGDVKNLIGYPGGCDSSWMDIGAPVLTTPDGRKYKMLVAPLIVDLDGRVNLNVHGNILLQSGTSGVYGHASYLGLGPWEVNLSKVLTAVGADGVTPEWPNLFAGSSQPTLPGRYGPNKVPVGNIVPANNFAPPILTPYPYGQIVYGGGAKTRIQLPSALPNAAGQLSCFPTYPVGFDNASLAARTNHPLIYSPYTPFPASLDSSSNPSPFWNRRFRLSNMDRFLRWNDTGMEALTSELERMLPYNFNDPNDQNGSFLRRNLVTLIDGDRNQPGIAPYIWDQALAPYGSNYTNAASLVVPPQGTPPIFPTPPKPPQPTVPGDFTADWRSAITASSGQALPRLDLNNPFAAIGRNPPYLTPYPSTATNASTSLTDPPPSSMRFDTDANYAQFMQAQQDRQFLARQIYLRLLAVTGLTASAINPATSPNGPANPSDPDLRTRRWLAQLAVNMVDYIDNDDISTPFNFYTAQDANPTNTNPAPAFDPSATVQLPGPQYPGAKNPPTVTTPKYWVFGTELPRVVINEVLGEYTLPANDTTTNLPPVNSTYLTNFWVELYNPMDSAATISKNANVTANDTNPVSLGMPTLATLGQTQNNALIQNKLATGYAAYQIVIGDQNMLPTSTANPIPENNNVLGLPLNVRAQTNDNDFATAGAVQAIQANNNLQPANAASPATLAPQSYLILAPNNPSFMDAHQTIAVKTANTPNGTLTAGMQILPSANLQYQSTISVPNVTPMTLNPAVDNTILTSGATVMLQRLANPHIPYNPTVMWTNPNTSKVELNPWYNPYVTIDYISSIPVWNSTTNGYESVGKTQPYAALCIPSPNTNPPSPKAPTTSPVLNQTAGFGTVHHSFGTQNTPNASQQGGCNWLTHLDRALVSPVELLHVSQFQPHQLTQKFQAAFPDFGGTNTYQHAPVSTWYDERTRLYRVFEFFETRDRLASVTDGQRTTGKININSIWDEQTFQALCDAQAGNYFTGTNSGANNDVHLMWNQLLLLRSPNYSVANGTFQIGPTNMALNQVDPSVAPLQLDRPFLGHATGPSTGNTALYSQYPWTQGINDTIFRMFAQNADPNSPNTPTAPRLFVLANSTQTAALKKIQVGNTGTTDPYMDHQLLTKIFNNTTTRSNTFAVFLTVGFFEVTDDTVRPVKLGAEMNASEGRAIRHRMFAIIDRTVLANNPYPSTNAANAPAPKQPYRPSADTSGVVPYWTIIN